MKGRRTIINRLHLSVERNIIMYTLGSINIRFCITNGVTSNSFYIKRDYTGYSLSRYYIGKYMCGFGLINMNGRLYDPYVQRFLSPDNVVQEPNNAQNYNRYSYCLNNPLMYTDPTGWKIYLSSRSQIKSVNWDDGDEIFNWQGQQVGTMIPGMDYREGDYLYFNYAGMNGEDVSSFSLCAAEIQQLIRPGMPNQIAGHNYRMESSAFNRFTSKFTCTINEVVILGNRKDGYLRSSDVLITFDPNSDNIVYPKLSDYLRTILTKASMRGIKSINISCTTNHPSNPNSAHKLENGARALDISTINGVAVSTNNPFVSIMQNIIRSTPGYLENYGPMIINKVSNGDVIPAPWARSIPGGHYNHIHISVPW